MKKIILFFIATVYVTLLHANMMSDFRRSQRHLVLADFKALYKQRHLSSHKAELRHKYKRVKKISHSGVLEHYHHTDTKVDNTSTYMPDSMDTQNVSMQTEANHDLQTIEEHHSNQKDIQESGGNTEIPNDNMSG